MASGTEHSSAVFGAAVGFGAAVAIERTVSSSAMPFLVGMLMGILVSPDMDVDDGNISYYYFRKIYLEWYWKALWRPYALTMNHRGWSHFPIMSTVFRLIYMAFPVTIFLSVFGGKRVTILSTLLAQIAAIPFLSLFLFIALYYPQTFVQATLGLVFADIIHLILDII